MASVTHQYILPFSEWADGVVVWILANAQNMTVDGMARSTVHEGSPISVKLREGAKELISADGTAANDVDLFPVSGSGATTLKAGMAHTLKLAAGDDTAVDPATLFLITIVELDPMFVGVRKTLRKARKARRK